VRTLKKEKLKSFFFPQLTYVGSEFESGSLTPDPVFLIALYNGVARRRQTARMGRGDY
jgi:hypothetical protein